MKDTLHRLCPGLTEDQLNQFQRYYALLLDWNARMNLTAITAPEEVASKHFADSLTAASLLPKGASVIDVGTGAGFPGLPLLIVRPDLKLTLLDGVNKRLLFLSAVCDELKLPARKIHMRAEDAGKDPTLREKFDVALTRAVAALPVLVELTLPLVRVGGKSIAYKADVDQELEQARNALHLLHAVPETEVVDCSWGKRTLVVLTKTAPTPKAYPRKAGTPGKNPL